MPSLTACSVDLAQVVLQQYYSHAEDSLLKRDLLAGAHILELGYVSPLIFNSIRGLMSRYQRRYWST